MDRRAQRDTFLHLISLSLFSFLSLSPSVTPALTCPKVCPSQPHFNRTHLHPAVRILGDADLQPLTLWEARPSCSLLLTHQITNKGSAFAELIREQIKPFQTEWMALFAAVVTVNHHICSVAPLPLVSSLRSYCDRTDEWLQVIAVEISIHSHRLKQCIDSAVLFLARMNLILQLKYLKCFETRLFTWEATLH